MHIKEIRELTPEELDAHIATLRQKSFELNRKRAVGQLENGNEITTTRKELAKALTVKRERELQIK